MRSWVLGASEADGFHGEFAGEGRGHRFDHRGAHPVQQPVVQVLCIVLESCRGGGHVRGPFTHHANVGNGGDRPLGGVGEVGNAHQRDACLNEERAGRAGREVLPGQFVPNLPLRRSPMTSFGEPSLRRGLELREGFLDKCPVVVPRTGSQTPASGDGVRCRVRAPARHHRLSGLPVLVRAHRSPRHRLRAGLICAIRLPSRAQRRPTNHRSRQRPPQCPQ